MSFHRHRTRNPRNCDHCPPGHKAVWIFKEKHLPSLYLCDEHARRQAHTMDIEEPPGL